MTTGSSARLALGAMTLSATVLAAQQQVGTSKDGCDRSEVVRLQGRDSTRHVRANREAVVLLPSFTTEITWFCGDSRERAANDREFNEVKVSRAKNGAITWRFRVRNEPVTPAGNDTDGPTIATTVGFTNDACGAERTVRFDARAGRQRINAPSPRRRFPLENTVKEMEWSCGGSEERVANDVAFNVVFIERAKNGAIRWQFDRVEETAPAVDHPPSGLVRVGDTREACDRSNMVRFISSDGVVRVAAGGSRLFHLPAVTRQVSWSCFDSAERSANPVAFDWLSVTRAGNGALQLIFYRANAMPPGPSGDVRAGRYVHNGSGVMNVRIRTPGGNVDSRLSTNNVKTLLDSMWEATFRRQVDSIVRSFEADSLHINGTSIPHANATVNGQIVSSTELRTRTENGVTVVKYVVHGNRVDAKITLPDPMHDPNLRFFFDLELVAPIRIVRDSQPLRARGARARVRRVEIDGDDNDANAETALAWAVPRIRASETALSNSVALNITAQVDSGLAAVGKSAPPGSRLRGIGSTDAGGLAVCFTMLPNPGCVFMPHEGSPPARRALDSTTGQCSAATIWLRDAERNEFVAIKKGGTDVIELDHRRFEWFCGGDHAPDFRNQEWETGPRETHAVRVRRAATGRQVTFEFLDWRTR